MIDESLPWIYHDQLALHASNESCWIVIKGLVYDVTEFHHPGGNDRLFDLGGQDATSGFEAVRHSSAAARHLRRLLVGRLGEQTSPTSGSLVASQIPAQEFSAAAATSAHANQKSRNRLLKAGSIHRKARPGERLWSTRCRGFLPVRDPITAEEALLPYQLLIRLVERMPVALADGSFRRLVESSTEAMVRIESSILAEQSEDVLERVHSLLGYIGKGYVHGGEAVDGAQSVPKFLADPWIAVSDRLGRHPTIDYANCVLYNWERIDKRGPIIPDNIRILNRFTGLLDEEWFLKTHVIIESEASGVVSAIYDGNEAIVNKDMNRLMAMLSWLEQAMSHVASNCLFIMFERESDDNYLCEPDIFFHRFRPYISTWTALFEGQYEDGPSLVSLRAQLQMVQNLECGNSGLPDLSAHRKHLEAAIAAMQRRKRLCGPSGAMSSILPLCDAFLDVQMSSPELGTMLKEFEEYMPEKHRKMLLMVRQNSARPFIIELHAQGDPMAALLIENFNAVVRRVLDFRWRHLSYIEQYIAKPAGGSFSVKGTGGTPAFNYLNQHINDTEMAIISVMHESDCEAEALGDAFPASAYLSPPEPHELWAVTEWSGLLPTSSPIPMEEMPAPWNFLCELVRRLPAACVPPSTFRALVKRYVDQLPLDCSALDGDAALERGRTLVAFVLAGWYAEGEYVGLHRQSSGEQVEAIAALTATPPLTPYIGPAAPPPSPPMFFASGDSHCNPPEFSLFNSAADPLQVLLVLFVELSKRVRRAPRIGLTDIILYNWTQPADKAYTPSAQVNNAVGVPGGGEPHEQSAGGVVADLHPRLKRDGGVKPCLRFLCFEEEDWFVRLHVTLANETGCVMRAIHHCLDATKLGEQVQALRQLEQAIEVLINVHCAAGIGRPMGADAPFVRPALLMKRLHRFLPYHACEQLGLDPHELRALIVYCATGIDQSCLLHVFGIDSGTHLIQRFREWQQGKDADVPRAHYDFLVAMRQRMSMRERVEAAVGVKSLSVQELARLELAHNSCIDMTVRLFSRRIELVRAMCGEDALKDEWDVERSLILRARLQLLIERREMLGPKQGLPKLANLYHRDPTERGR